MAGFEFSCAQQQGLGGLQPVDRQGLELLKGHASHRRFQQLGDAIGTGLVITEGEQGSGIEAETGHQASRAASACRSANSRREEPPCFPWPRKA